MSKLTLNRATASKMVSDRRKVLLNKFMSTVSLCISKRASGGWTDLEIACEKRIDIDKAIEQIEAQGYEVDFYHRNDTRECVLMIKWEVGKVENNK